MEYAAYILVYGIAIFGVGVAILRWIFAYRCPKCGSRKVEIFHVDSRFEDYSWSYVANFLEGECRKCGHQWEFTEYDGEPGPRKKYWDD